MPVIPTQLRRLAFALLAAGCGGEKAPPDSPTPQRIAVAERFYTPESVRWDSTTQLWYVSNINGNPSEKDGNGFIARLTPDGARKDSTPFIVHGSNGVVLHAPKGMAIADGVLWVADIDAVRGFDLKSGAPVASLDIAPLGAKFLNDVAVGGDGNVYITDTGIHFDAKGAMTHPGPDRVFMLQARRIVEVLAFANAPGPNGIAWDAANQRFLINAFAAPTLMAWKPGAATADSIAPAPGDGDGLEVLPDGRVLYTSWADSALHVYANGSFTKLIPNLPAPADIGFDPVRNIVAIPLFNDGRVEFWRLPKP